MQKLLPSEQIAGFLDFYRSVSPYIKPIFKRFGSTINASRINFMIWSLRWIIKNGAG